MQLNLGKVKGEDGTNVYVKYNSSPSDTGAADFWSQGQGYIGVLCSSSKTKPTSGYTWTKFVGDNGIDGKNCYIKYNTIANDSGATTNWTVGQDYIGFVLSNAATAPTSGYTWSRFMPSRTDFFNMVYPIGSIYTSINEINPSNLFGGNWFQITGRVLVAAGTSDATYTAGAIGGASRVALSVDEMPSHDYHVDNGAGNGYYLPWRMLTEFGGGWGYHAYTDGQHSNISTQALGGNQSHENMPPYYVVYMWQRIA